MDELSRPLRLVIAAGRSGLILETVESRQPLTVSVRVEFDSPVRVLLYMARPLGLLAV